MGFGDEILAAGQAQRLYDSDPFRLRVGIFDKHDKPRWHPIWDGNPIIAHPDDIARGEPVHVVRNGPDLRPYYIPPFSRQGGWTFNKAFKAREHIAKIYLTPQERALGDTVREWLGPFVLIEPWSKHENLRWPMSHWEALVAARPKIKFVQHIHRETSLIVPGVVTLKATFREACGLVLASSVYIRGESGMLHATAALRKPSIAIWGGCMDWEVLGGYPLQHGVGIDLDPCGSWMPCEHCRLLMSKITVQEVLSELDKLGVE